MDLASSLQGRRRLCAADSKSFEGLIATDHPLLSRRTKWPNLCGVLHRLSRRWSRVVARPDHEDGAISYTQATISGGGLAVNSTSRLRLRHDLRWATGRRARSQDRGRSSRPRMTLRPNAYDWRFVPVGSDTPAGAWVGGLSLIGSPSRATTEIIGNAGMAPTAQYP